jgi:hypothetical protein
MAKVPSAGDKFKEKDENDTDEVLSIPDWNKGITLHENIDWFVKLQVATQEDIEGVSQKLIFTCGSWYSPVHSLRLNSRGLQWWSSESISECQVQQWHQEVLIKHIWKLENDEERGKKEKERSIQNKHINVCEQYVLNSLRKGRLLTNQGTCRSTGS